MEVESGSERRAREQHELQILLQELILRMDSFVNVVLKDAYVLSHAIAEIRARANTEVLRDDEVQRDDEGERPSNIILP